MTLGMRKMKVSLCEAINAWIGQQVEDETDGWSDLGIPVGDLTAEIMTDAAFNILLAQQNQNSYLFNNDMLKED